MLALPQIEPAEATGEAADRPTQWQTSIGRLRRDDVGRPDKYERKQAVGVAHCSTAFITQPKKRRRQ